LELMRRSVAENAVTVVSLFVNPTQFGPKEDIAKYPRDEERDSALAASVGVDFLFCPEPSEIYPLGLTTVSIKEVTANWEGAQRPTHFAGVATVVAKLFNIVQPHRSYFGLKDLQQCAVVRTLVADLLIPVELIFLETVREPSGLAMSSRNEYLTPENRHLASLISKELRTTAKSLLDSNSQSMSTIQQSIQRLGDAGFVVDYYAIVDSRNMKLLDSANEFSRLMIAVRLQGVRLLDNVPI
jgi:pantoate--beta-alanine ligase